MKNLIHRCIIRDYGENDVRSGRNFRKVFYGFCTQLIRHRLGDGMVVIVDRGDLIIEVRKAAGDVSTHPTHPHKSNFRLPHCAET